MAVKVWKDAKVALDDIYGILDERETDFKRALELGTFSPYPPAALNRGVGGEYWTGRNNFSYKFVRLSKGGVEAHFRLFEQHKKDDPKVKNSEYRGIELLSIDLGIMDTQYERVAVGFEKLLETPKFFGTPDKSWSSGTTGHAEFGGHALDYKVDYGKVELRFSDSGIPKKAVYDFAKMAVEAAANAGGN